jgi:FkbM family methyltransferase
MFLKDVVRTTIIEAAKKQGYEVVPSWKIEQVPLANHLRKVLEQNDIQIVLDVGGNLGQYRDFLRNDVGFKGRILSFEPVRKYSELLKSRSAVDPLWHIYDFALGCEEGEASINVTRSPGLNSFLAARTDVVDGFWSEGAVVAVEKVQIRMLDNVLAEAGIDCVASNVYLKLDTQGFDLEVIKGATRSLPKIRALQTEASIRPIYAGMPTFLETVAAMTANSFDLSGMFPVTHDDNLRLIELDFVFINNLFVKPWTVQNSNGRP